MPSSSTFKILSLDGGGAKGFYTLGILHEIEALAARPLYQQFDLIIGTSTGSIIAALLALGARVETIHALYAKHVTKVVAVKSRAAKSEALRALGKKVFGDKSFADAKTGLSVVGTSWRDERPMIFKSRADQAHGRSATFVPGFGCSVAQAVIGSCSAYPYFERASIKLGDGSAVELIDGGFCANNPTLYAIADGVAGSGFVPENLRVVSLGVGVYPLSKPRLFSMNWLAKHLMTVELLQKTLEINAQSMDQLRTILFKNVPTVRISDTFHQPQLATDLFEHDLEKLSLLYVCGRESFAKAEAELKSLLALG
jgi:uncharacterized protein